MASPPTGPSGPQRRTRTCRAGQGQAPGPGRRARHPARTNSSHHAGRRELAHYCGGGRPPGRLDGNGRPLGAHRRRARAARRTPLVAGGGRHSPGRSRAADVVVVPAGSGARRVQRDRHRDRHRGQPSQEAARAPHPAPSGAPIGREVRGDLAERKQRQAQRQERRKAPGPLRDGHVWLNSQTAALLLGVGRTRVSQLAARGSLPHQRHGGRLWFRRDQIEQVAAARAFTHRVIGVRDACPTPPRG